MRLMQTYSNALSGQLRRHYGADEYELTHMKHSVVLQHVSVFISIIFGILAWEILPRPFYHIAGVVIAVISVIMTVTCIYFACAGYRKAADLIFMTFATCTLFGGICISGGFPYSIVTFMTVVLPMLALGTYGMRIGLMTAVAVPVAGGLQWYAQELLGWTSTIYPETGPSVVSYFLIWLIGYSLILLFVFTKYKEARALQGLLDAERMKFSQLATTDNLTELANARKFGDELDALIETITGTGQVFHVAFLDLNKFKSINDNYGHETGDLVLQLVAGRLKQCVRGVGMAARLGGDEFVLILRETLSEQGVEDILTRVKQRISEPIVCEGAQLWVTASIGLTQFPRDGVTRKELVNTADLRMYTDKAENQKRRA